MRRYIGIAVSLGLLLVVSPPQASAQGQGQAAAPVQIVAPLPVPVTDSTNPAYHPFQALLCNPGCQIGGPEPDPTTFVRVPLGTRLVIEYISGFCSSPVDVTVTFLRLDTVAGGVIETHLPGPPEARGISSSSSGDRRIYTFSQMVRIYADPGSLVRMSIDQLGLGLANCDLHLSGHTVALP
jgi:hypothetical protein